MQLLRSLASNYLRNLRAGRHEIAPSVLPTVPVFDRSISSVHGEAKRTLNESISAHSSSSSQRFHFSTWIKWALGSMLAVILPFWSNQWKTLLRIEGEVEMAAEVVEAAAEVVEKAAMVADEVSSELADKLPEDGKLKSAVLLVEHVAKEAAAEAHLAQDIIHKVDEVKLEVEMLFNPKKLVNSEDGHMEIKTT